MNVQALGATCYSPADPTFKNCGWDNRCDTTGGLQACATCKAYVGLGQPCDPNGFECATDLYCNTTSRTCQTQLALDTPCTLYGSGCAGNLHCTGTGSSGTCKPLVLPGQACPQGSSCVEGTSCVAGTCTANLADGAACPRNPDNGQCLGYCVFASADAAMGVCQANDPAPTAGQPCTLWGRYESCDETVYAHATYGDLTSVACECRARHATGACTTFGECTGTCADGMCAPIKALGVQCTYAFECASGRCNGTVDPPVCAAGASCQ